MHRRHLLRFYYAIHHKPSYTNVFYAIIFFVVLYTLYYLPSLTQFSIYPDKGPSLEFDVPPEEWAARAEEVKQAFLHAYHGYEKYAAPGDELLPLSKKRINNFNGWGLTVFDSLDTMLLLGLDDEFKRALPIVQKANFSMATGSFVPYFETVIRYLGGLLSAYALSGQQMLLDRADDLATKLDGVFNTTSGLPYYSVNPTDNRTSGPNVGILAEIASLQLEYTYLARATGKGEHFKRADNIMKVLASANLTNTGGMLPVRWNLTSGEPNNYQLSVGAQADSAHEYLLKQHLLTSKTDKRSLEMYIRATTHIISNLLFLSPTRQLLYVSDTWAPTFEREAQPSRRFEHLSCFLPGLLALGAHTLPLDKLDSIGIDLNKLGKANFGYASTGYKILSGYNLKELHLSVAEGLAETCWLSYADQSSGLGPDEMIFDAAQGKKIWNKGAKTWGYEVVTYPWIDAVEKWRKSGHRGSMPGFGNKRAVVYSEEQKLSSKASGRDYIIGKNGYLLRPETIESLYLLWRITGDQKWRARGWAIFQAIERHTKSPSGYASLKFVDVLPPVRGDSMPSYFLAETLKYLYLMFIDKDVLPLNQWVFNTEAHPFPVFEWTQEEKDQFGID